MCIKTGPACIKTGPACVKTIFTGAKQALQENTLCMRKTAIADAKQPLQTRKSSFQVQRKGRINQTVQV